MKKFFIPLILTSLLTLACGGRQEKSNIEEQQADTLAFVLEGDSTLYGLVCEGSTDTLLIFLPNDKVAEDPDTLNILDATRKRNIFGQLMTGDDVAVVRNNDDSTVADIVISMKNLRSTWRYKVLPTLHLHAGMDGMTEQQMIANLPDSVSEQLAVPHEYVLDLQNDHSVYSYSTVKMNQEQESVVEYPKAKHYGTWHLFNGKLLLTRMQIDTLGNLVPEAIDTAQFVMMNRDTLILNFSDGMTHYYPAKTTEE
jgi:hypothetical protein